MTLYFEIISFKMKFSGLILSFLADVYTLKTIQALMLFIEALIISQKLCKD